MRYAIFEDECGNVRKIKGFWVPLKNCVIDIGPHKYHLMGWDGSRWRNCVRIVLAKGAHRWEVDSDDRYTITPIYHQDNKFLFDRYAIEKNWNIKNDNDDEKKAA